MPEPTSSRRKRPAAPAIASSERGLPHALMQQIAAAKGDPDFMTSLGRGLVVLSVFAQHAREVTMSQISLETGISRAAVRRVLPRLPAYCTSMGRVLLAALPADTLQAYLERTTLRPRTDRTVTQPAALLEVLARARREGVCLTDQELEIGLRSIAVPVRNLRGEVIAALNIGAQAGRVSLQTMQTQWVEPLKQAAQRLGALLS